MNRLDRSGRDVFWTAAYCLAFPQTNGQREVQAFPIRIKKQEWLADRLGLRRRTVEPPPDNDRDGDEDEKHQAAVGPSISGSVL